MRRPVAPVSVPHAVLRPVLLPALLLGLLLAPGRAAAGEEAPEEAPPPVPAAYVHGQTAFGCDLYRALAAGGEGNLLVGSHSVATTLAMAWVGARGETARAMAATLHMPEPGPGPAPAAQQAALAAPMVQEGYGADAEDVPAWQLDVANALWVQAGYPLERAFVDRLAQAYGAAVQAADFREPDVVRERINAWVAERTHERIEDLVPAGQPTPDTRLVLANAVYLKAPWETPFQERATRKQAFHRPDGTSIEVDMMHREARLPWREEEHAHVVVVPYRGPEDGLAMVLVVPKEVGGLPAIEGALDADDVARWLAAPRSRKIALGLPRFTFESSFDLTQPLAALGMDVAFKPGRADFSGMTEAERLFIGVVVHKTYVAVDEKGTEAAAATALTMRATGVPPPEEPVRVVADRPFLFLIAHRGTGTVLFLGRVTQPASD